jgi:hypothetical protein
LQPRTSLTYDLFGEFFHPDFEKETFDIAELGISGNLRDAARVIVNMVYRFNQPTREAVATQLASLSLPARYAAIHVRRGDKSVECSETPDEAYLDKLDAHSELKDVFIFTDDYTVVERLRAKRPDLRFHTLAGEEQRGYFHAEFVARSCEAKQRDLIMMLASVEAMARADLTVGTFTTNPGLFLGMYMPENRFVSVQRSSWCQFDR